jgi:hypothetical protein
MGRCVLVYVTFGLALSWRVSAAAQSFVLSPPSLLGGTETGAPGLCARMTECFTLRVSSLHVRARATVPSGRTGASTTAAPPPRSAVSLGADFALRGGRALHLQLTPTPTQCAPLLSLRY